MLSRVIELLVRNDSRMHFLRGFATLYRATYASECFPQLSSLRDLDVESMI